MISFIKTKLKRLDSRTNEHLKLPIDSEGKAYGLKIIVNPFIPTEKDTYVCASVTKRS